MHMTHTHFRTGSGNEPRGKVRQTAATSEVTNGRRHSSQKKYEHKRTRSSRPLPKQLTSLENRFCEKEFWRFSFWRRTFLVLTTSFIEKVAWSQITKFSKN